MDDRGGSFGTFVRNQRRLLSQRVSALIRVYLDTNYWIYLRDARMGQPRCPAHRTLYETLRAAVLGRKVVCPVTDNAVYEVLRQDSLASRTATAEVMDELSTGVALDSSDQRLRIEILHYLRTRQEGADALHPLSEWVWTHACWVLSEMYPTSNALPPDIQRELQIAFYQEMLKLGVTGLMKCLASAPAPFPDDVLIGMAKRLTEGKFRHTRQLRSFKQVFMTEVAGVLDCYRHEIADALRYICNRGQIDPPPVDHAIAGITAAFRTGTVGTALPSVNILAGLHALFRWNRNQRYKPNDSFDHLHASAALPHFHLFLTENALARAVTSPLLKYDQLYGTVVCSDPTAALAALEAQIL